MMIACKASITKLRIHVAGHYSQFTIHHSQFTIHHSLFTIHSVSFHIHHYLQNSCALRSSSALLLNGEIPCFAVMANNSTGGLFRHKLKLLCKLHTNAFRLEKRKELLLIFQVGACGIPE